jgi:hypothetical protein
MEPNCASNQYPAAETFNNHDDLLKAYRAIQNDIYSLTQVVQDSKLENHILKQDNETLKAKLANADARIIELTMAPGSNKRLRDEYSKRITEETETALRLEAQLVSTIQESETKVKALEKQLEDGRKKIIELETKLASRPQVDTELFGLRIIESYAHKSMDLEKRLRASTEQAAKLSAENRQLADSNWRTNRLFEQLLPLGGGGTAIDHMNRSLDDLEQKFKQIRSHTLDVARTSRAYLKFRDDKLAHDLSAMTAKHAHLLAKFRDLRSRKSGEELPVVEFEAASSSKPPPKKSKSYFAMEEELKKAKADLACSNRLREEAERRLSAYEDIMISNGISHRQMAGVLDGCVRSDRLMAPLSKRTNGVSLDGASQSPSFQYWKL